MKTSTKTAGAMISSKTQLYLGEVWHTPRQPPFAERGEDFLEHFEHGGLVVDAEGTIIAIGDGSALRQQHPMAEIHDFGDDLIIPGFVDTHLHFPQLDMLASYGEQLLGWLESYTYPSESAFDDPAFATEAAPRFFLELLANGTTTTAIYATSHRSATEALFAEAEASGVRAIIGKVSMDHGAPERLLQSAADDEEANEALIKYWHGRHDRLFVALTPRFAPVCSESLLASLGALKKRHPSVYVQTHHAENRSEVELVKKLFPHDPTYLHVYHRFGLLDAKTILGHSIHISASEWDILQACKAAIAHCPTSNLFLGSGLLPMRELVEKNIRLSLASDIGAGTSLSPWRTMAAAYEIQQLRNQTVSPVWLFYLATLGGAAALSLEDETGSFTAGKAADFQILDWTRSRLLSQRWRRDTSPFERLFAMLFMADDRLVKKVFVQGKECYSG